MQLFLSLIFFALYSAQSNVSACPCPDVDLNVQNLQVNYIGLTVNKLQAHVSLSATIGNLLKLQAGVDASISSVSLIIEDVKAEVELVVRLGNVVAIVNRTMDTLDQNPNLLTGLISAVEGLLSKTVGVLGQLIQRTVLQTGEILQQVLDSSNNVLSSSIVGNVTSLPIVNTFTNSIGQTVKWFQDTSGKVIQVTYDSAGNIVDATTM